MSVYVILEQEGYEVKYDKAKLKIKSSFVCQDNCCGFLIDAKAIRLDD